MIEEIKNIVLELCVGVEDDWQSHVESVVHYAKVLAKELGADEEVCEIAAWLHDIEKIRGHKENHHVLGAQKAMAILRGLHCAEHKMQQIEHCILSHSSDKNYVPQTVEAKIVACADALSHFDNFSRLAYRAYRTKNLSLAGGRVWLQEKYKKSWDKLSMLPEARELARAKYDAIQLVLGE
jgi:uncharacterized protein